MLENSHASAIALMLEYRPGGDICENLTEEEKKFMIEAIVDFVLATDMFLHDVVSAATSAFLLAHPPSPPPPPGPRPPARCLRVYELLYANPIDSVHTSFRPFWEGWWRWALYSWAIFVYGYGSACSFRWRLACSPLRCGFAAD